MCCKQQATDVELLGREATFSHTQQQQHFYEKPNFLSFVRDFKEVFSPLLLCILSRVCTYFSIIIHSCARFEMISELRANEIWIQIQTQSHPSAPHETWNCVFLFSTLYIFSAIKHFEKKITLILYDLMCVVTVKTATAISMDQRTIGVRATPSVAVRRRMRHPIPVH